MSDIIASLNAYITPRRVRSLHSLRSLRSLLGGNMARPVSKNGYREKRLTVRFSEAEWEEIANECNKAQVSISDFVRAKTIGGKLLRSRKPPVPELNRVAYMEMARTQANLNQIAHQLNAGKSSDSELILETIQKLYQETLKLRMELIGGVGDS